MPIFYAINVELKWIYGNKHHVNVFLYKMQHSILFLISLHQKMSEEYQAKHNNHDSNHASSEAADIARTL